MMKYKYLIYFNTVTWTSLFSISISCIDESINKEVILVENRDNEKCISNNRMLRQDKIENKL